MRHAETRRANPSAAPESEPPNMMNLAQCHVIRDHSVTERPGESVGNDMGSVEQLSMSEAAYRTSNVVREHDLACEHWLMQPPLSLRHEIAAKRSFHRRVDVDTELLRRESHDELGLVWFLGDQVDRRNDVELARRHADEPHQRSLPPHSASQAFVLRGSQLIMP
jgi:hypothetical protein